LVIRVSTEAAAPLNLGEDALLELLQRAAEQAGFGITVTLVEEPYRSVYVSQLAQKILGRGVEELNSQGGVLSSVAPEAMPAILERKARSERGEPLDDVFETIIARPNGERVPIQVAASNATIAGHRCTVACILDLSTRRWAESALRESEERFRKVVQNAPDGVAILKQGAVVYLNERAGRMLGLATPEQGYGRRITEFMDPDDAVTAERRIRRLVETGQQPSEPHEYRSRSVDGRELIVEISSIPIELDGGRAVLAFARDVTERKAIQARLAQAERLSALGVLSAGVAHEINNPLAYVVLNLEFMERELSKPNGTTTPESLLERVRQARHGAERVATIVRDLKTFARADGWTRGPVRIESVLESALNVAQSETAKSASITRRYADVPAVLGNGARLEQVFLNLVLNAAQAIPEGDPHGHEIRVELDSNGDTVRVEVTDDGVGMSPDVLDRIFDPFFTTKPPGIGTGLGLPICRSIVRAHGGELDVRSAPGQGSTFTVVLPRWVGERKKSEPSGPGEAPPDAPRGRILVIDDEAAVGRTLSLVLEPEYDVTVVTSAQEGLAELRASDGSGRFDAILCDLVMPGMNGQDLFDAARTELPGIESRFIFMSGGYSSVGPEEFPRKVSNLLFEKPFDLNLVRRALREIVGEGRSGHT
jgi:two-component system, cell cycle sensor histidine kinase and response regulator CckA